MPNPLEFFKSIFSKTGEAVSEAASTAAGALKGGVSIDVGMPVPSSGASIPDAGGIVSALKTGVEALNKTAQLSSDVNKTVSKNFLDVDTAIKPSIALQNQIRNDASSKISKNKTSNIQPINALRGSVSKNNKIKENISDDFSGNAQANQMTQAQILYGPREKTKKEIEIEKSYPKYIEDFSPAQLLYADKEIIRKAEQASSGRNGNKRAWLEPNNDVAAKNAPTSLRGGIDIEKANTNISGSGKEISSDGKYVERNPKLNNEVKAFLQKLNGIDLSDKNLVDKIFNDMSNDLRELLKKGFDNFIKEKTPEQLADMIGEGYKELHNKIAQMILGKDAAGMLDISRPVPNDADYIKDAFKFESYKDTKLIKFQEYLKGKLKSQFKGYDINKIQGYYFPPNSEPSKRILQDSYFREFLKANKQNILTGQKKLSVDFKTGNMYYAHHLADVIVEEITPEGNLRVIVADTNDFNPGDPSKLVQAGEIAMKKGDLIPLFVLKEVEIPKTELDKIWK